MKPPSYASTAITLALFGWVTYCFGNLLQMGDPAPWLSATEIAKLYQPGKVFNVIGIFLLLSALWLSGFTFSYARKRASIALMIVLLPSLFFIYIYIGL